MWLVDARLCGCGREPDDFAGGWWCRCELARCLDLDAGFGACLGLDFGAAVASWRWVGFAACFGFGLPGNSW